MFVNRVKCDRSFFGTDGQQRMSTSSLSRNESGISKQTLDSQNHKKKSSNGRGRDACAFNIRPGRKRKLQ